MSIYKCRVGSGQRVPHFFRFFQFSLPEDRGRRVKGLFTLKFHQESNGDNAMVTKDIVRDIMTYLVGMVVESINFDVLYIKIP